MIKHFLLFSLTLFLISSTATAGFNLGNWSTFNASKSVSSSSTAKTAGLSLAMLTGTFSCSLTQTNPNCLNTLDYLPGLETAVLSGQLEPSLFCYTLMLSGVDVTANYQGIYCSNPAALPSGIVVEPVFISTYVISGAETANANSIQTYSYPSAVGNYYAWNVVNGVILAGQGSGTITVQWSSQCGIVQVAEFVDGICPAPTVCMDVQIIGANCVFPGCNQPGACNYDPFATINDGSCLYPAMPCDDLNSSTINDAYNDNCVCEGIGNGTVSGCTDPFACNYNSFANLEDGTCTYPGCDDPNACNFDALAGCSDGSCLYLNAGNIIGNSNPLIGDTVVYSTTFAAGQEYSWSVSGAGNIISVNGNVVTVQWNNSGNYFVELTINNGPCSASSTLNVNVDCEFPNVTILGDQGIQNGSIVTFSTGIIEGATYNWAFVGQEGNIISGLGTNAVQVQFGDNFQGGTLSVTVGADSCSDSFDLLITDVIDIRELDNHLRIFPNPASDMINVAGFESIAELSYVITDAYGRYAGAGRLWNNQIDVSSFPCAVYTLELRGENATIARKRFIKK